MESRPRALKAVSKAEAERAVETKKATIKNPIKIAASHVGADDPSFGIVITVPDPADIDYGAVNTITPNTNFPGRAVLFPPGSVANVDPQQYTFVAFICRALGPTPLFIPANAQGLLFADLPNGPLPPNGSTNLFDAISSAIRNQVGPPPPDGTGNG